MKNIFLHILFISTTLVSFAQDEFLIRGHVLSSDSVGIDVVNILNLNHPTGTVTNASGSFTLTVHIGDTLLFSAIQYKNVKVGITEEMRNKTVINVLMEFDNITLQDVVLTDFSMYDTNDTGGDVNLGLPFNTKAIVRPYAERKMDYLSGGILSFINSLNGKKKKLREVQAYKGEQDRIEGLKERYPNQFYLDLGIPKDEIYVFIDFYYPEAKEKGLLRSGFQFELIQFIKDKAELYIPLNSVNKNQDTLLVKP